MESTTVDPAFAEHHVRANLVQKFPDPSFESRIILQGPFDRPSRIEHQIHIRGRCPRMIENEAKRTTVLRVTSAEIGAHERRWWPILLHVPWRPVPTEIAFGDALDLSFFQISPQLRIPLFDFRFLQLAIEQEDPSFQHRVSDTVRLDLIFRQVARTRQYRPERLHRQFTAFDVVCRQNEVIVIPRRQTTPYLEEIAQNRSIRCFNPLLHRVPRPLRIATQSMDRHQKLKLWLFQ